MTSTDGGAGGFAPRWRALVAEAVAAGLDPAEARWLGEEATGAEGHGWQATLDRPCTPLTHQRFTAMVERRLAGEPLQYVVGHWPFRRLDLFVDRRVLIPRPETEWLVEIALRLLPERTPAVVADLGTGSGAIALALASERHPHVRVVATDVSRPALAVAGANLAGLGRYGTTVELRHGDWWDALPADLTGGFDLVASNPPYVAATDPLPAEVAEWEPVDALVPGPTGLEAIEVLAAGAPRWLAPGGWFVCEIGETQGPAAVAIAARAGLVDAGVRPDLSGRDRVLVARRRVRDR
jgi:release factor glutamine methyltransferase